MIRLTVYTLLALWAWDTFASEPPSDMAIADTAAKLDAVEVCREYGWRSERCGHAQDLALFIMAPRMVQILDRHYRRWERTQRPPVLRPSGVDPLAR